MTHDLCLQPRGCIPHLGLPQGFPRPVCSVRRFGSASRPGPHPGFTVTSALSSKCLDQTPARGSPLLPPRLHPNPALSCQLCPPSSPQRWCCPLVPLVFTPPPSQALAPPPICNTCEPSHVICSLALLQGTLPDHVRPPWEFWPSQGSLSSEHTSQRPLSGPWATPLP